jgi:hypothetical protein
MTKRASQLIKQRDAIMNQLTILEPVMTYFHALPTVK